MSQVYPRNFSHIGISVPDLEKAVEFYTQVMAGMSLWHRLKLLKMTAP